MSMSELLISLLAKMCEHDGLNRSAMVELIVRDYAERNGFLERDGK